MGTSWAIIGRQLKRHRVIVAAVSAAVLLLETACLENISMLPGIAVCTVIMVPEAILDGFYGKLYHKLSLSLLAAGIACNMQGMAWQELPGRLAESIGGSLCFGGLLLLIAVIRHNGLGFGDICFGTGLGAFLGGENVPAAFCLTFVLGLFTVICIYVRNFATGKKMPRCIPLGPLLLLGTMVSFLWGQELVAWYLKVI